jgi:hypothetical protein
MSPDTLANILERALAEAEQAHHAFEQANGPTDWPPFYAARLHGELAPDFTLEQVTTALIDAATAHGEYEAAHGGTRDEAWPRWYSEHMAGALSREWYSWLAEAEAWE